MVHLAVEELHLDHNPAPFGMAEDALQPGLAVRHPHLVIHPVAVPAETDQVAVTGVGHPVDVPGVAGHELLMQVGAVPAGREADLRAIAHG